MMKTSRIFLLASLLCGGFFLVGCDKEATTEPVTFPVDGPWQASFRVSSGELTETQLSQATWVRVEAWRAGSLLVYGEAAYSTGKVDLMIPSAGAVDIKLIGYSDQNKNTVIWTGSGIVASGVAKPGTGVVTLAAGPGLQTAPVARDSTLYSLSTTPGVFNTTFYGSIAGPYVDSVPSGTASVTVSAVANVSSDVQSIKYNGSTSNAVTLNTSGNTTIPVEVKNLNGNSKTYTITVVKKAAVVVPVPTYKLTTSATNGTISLSPSGGTYDSGTSVTATASANSGYTFSGWSGACTSTGACIVMMSAAKSLTASFMATTTAGKDSTLATLTLDGTKVNGFVAGVAGSGSRTYIDSVSATATTATLAATTTATGASVTGTGSVTLNATGVTTKTVTVINGTGSLVYTVNLYHKAAATGTTGSVIPWQTGITYGSVSDTAGQTYKTVKIGTQWWMAENLNYAGTSGNIGKCYKNSPDSCAKYGRLYTWAEVMQGKASSTTSPSGVQGLCPTNWHVPSDAEWTTMQNVVDAANTTDGTKLKSTVGWNNSGNGTDTYGFRALPGGYFDGTIFRDAGNNGTWWSASEGDASIAYYRNMGYNYAGVDRNYDTNADGLSLRCLKD